MVDYSSSCPVGMFKILNKMIEKLIELLKDLGRNPRVLFQTENGACVMYESDRPHQPIKTLWVCKTELPHSKNGVFTGLQFESLTQVAQAELREVILQ